MTTEWFTPRRGGSDGCTVARISIRPGGTMSISGPACKAGKFKGKDTVQVGFDAKTQLLAIAHATREPAYHLCSCPGTYSLICQCRKVMGHFGLTFRGRLPLHSVKNGVAYFGPIPPDKRKG